MSFGFKAKEVSVGLAKPKERVRIGLATKRVKVGLAIKDCRNALVNVWNVSCNVCLVWFSMFD